MEMYYSCLTEKIVQCSYIISPGIITPPNACHVNRTCPDKRGQGQKRNREGKRNTVLSRPTRNRKDVRSWATLCSTYLLPSKAGEIPSSKKRKQKKKPSTSQHCQQ